MLQIPFRKDIRQEILEERKVFNFQTLTKMFYPFPLWLNKEHI